MAKAQLNKLIDFCGSSNILELLEEEEITEIADKVENEFNIDKESMSKWAERVDKGMEIALQKVRPKTFPWKDASNIKYPLITNAAINYAARQYPQIVRGDRVVDFATSGKDDDGMKFRRARRLGIYHSWQLLIDSQNWESDTDKLLHMLAVIGTVFRKIYFNPIKNIIETEVCRPDRLIINNFIKDLDSARRITHIIHMSKNDIIERMRAGLYTEVDEDKLQPGFLASDLENTLASVDSDAPHELLEQHRYLDLDEDGYAEPYVATYHTGSRKLLRLVARYSEKDIKTDADGKLLRIEAKQYFTDYHFLPSPDGTFLSMGFGTLLYPLNDSIDTLINQLLDSGTLSNLSPMFLSSSARLKAANYKVAPGEIIKLEGAPGVKISDQLQMVSPNPPSPVLFQLLGLMIQSGKELASVTEILQGNALPQNSPKGTVEQLIDQGLVQYNAIHKRVLRAFTKEFRILFKLNRDYLDINKYLTLLDDPEASIDDFNVDDLDVRTVADPNLASEIQRMNKANMLLQVLGPSNPEILRRWLEAADIPGIDAIFKGMPQQPPAAEQKLLAEAQTEAMKGKTMLLDYAAKSDELKNKEKELALKEQELAHQLKELDARIRNLDAQSAAFYAQALKYKAEANAPTANSSN